MVYALEESPPDLGTFMSGKMTSPRAMALLLKEFNNAEKRPIFFALCPDSKTPVALKILREWPDHDEIGIFHEQNPSEEIEVTMFGLTSCNDYLCGARGAATHCFVNKKEETYRRHLRDVYTLHVPANASEVMALAFARQNATISELMDTIVKHPHFRSLQLKRYSKSDLDDDGRNNEKEEDGSKEEGKDKDNDEKESKDEDFDEIKDVGDYVAVNVLGPPTLKLDGDYLRKAVCPMKKRSHCLVPRDKLFDLDQTRMQNWQGHLIFDDDSVTLMKGKLRFRILDGNYLLASFVADSMRKIAGNAGGHYWSTSA